jgi:hypothetical protein
MSLSGEDKRKNDEPRRRFPIWVVAFAGGFILGVVFILITRPVSVQTAATFNSSGVSDEAIYLTATFIIDQATQTAQAGDTATPGVPSESSGITDPLLLTATAIVDSVTRTVEAQHTATRQAQATPTPTP